VPALRRAAGLLQRHGVRPRQFLVFAQECAAVCSYLTRWKCPLCGGRSLRIRSSRCLSSVMCCRSFWGGARPMWRTRRAPTKGVGEDGSVICHEDAESGSVLWPSTLWRWVDRLGRFPLLVRQRWPDQAERPSTDIFRALGARGFARTSSVAKDAGSYSNTAANWWRWTGVRPVVRVSVFPSWPQAVASRDVESPLLRKRSEP